VIDEEAASDPEEVLPALRTLINKARRLSILDLSLPTGGKLRVEIYKLVVKRGRPTSVFADSRNNQPVKTFTNKLAKDTGEILPSKSIETFMALGSSKVKVTSNDILKIKELSSGEEAAGVIVGFKPLSSLRLEIRVDTSFHIHPHVSAKKVATKDDVVNVTAFQALLRGMKRKGVYALARILVRHPGVQRFAALTAADNGGLTCIWLPYEDDLRIPPPVPQHKADSLQVEAAVNMFEAIDISGIEWGYR
jgi:non-homologous end joining protein Ku